MAAYLSRWGSKEDNSMDHHLGSQLIYCRLNIGPDRYRSYDTIPITKVRKVREEIESYIHETDGAERSPCPRGSGAVGGSSEGMAYVSGRVPLHKQTVVMNENVMNEGSRMGMS